MGYNKIWKVGRQALHGLFWSPRITILFCWSFLSVNNMHYYDRIHFYSILLIASYSSCCSIYTSFFNTCKIFLFRSFKILATLSFSLVGSHGNFLISPPSLCVCVCVCVPHPPLHGAKNRGNILFLWLRFVLIPNFLIQWIRIEGNVGPA